MKNAFPGAKRYIPFRSEVIELTFGEDGLWRSSDGVIIAYPYEPYDKNDVKAGIGFISMPHDDPITCLIAAHDYMYECPAYQMFHTRAEADADLKEKLKYAQGWRKILRYPFYIVSRIFGGFWWENNKTR